MMDSSAPHWARVKMAGLTVAAEAAPGAGWTLSALEAPGSTAWTMAATGAVASVLKDRTWYLDAPATTYSLVPVVAVPSRPPSSLLNGCHWPHVAPDWVRIWNWPPAETPPLGQVTPTTVTAPATSWAGVTAAALAVVIGSGAPGESATEPVASGAVRNAGTEDFTKPTWRTWLETGCGRGGEET